MPHVATGCKKQFTLGMVPVSTRKSRDSQEGSFLGPLLLGSHLAGIVGFVWYRVKGT